MQAWEHRCIIAEKHGKGIFGFVLPREISWKVHYVNGKVQQNWQDCTLYNYLNDEGAGGWEVISVVSHMSIRTGAFPIEHLYIMMKRPVEAKN
jgi:hypothetical protein